MDGSTVGISLGAFVGFEVGRFVGVLLGRMVEGDRVGAPGQKSEQTPDPGSHVADGLQHLFALPQVVPVLVNTQLLTLYV